MAKSWKNNLLKNSIQFWSLDFIIRFSAFLNLKIILNYLTDFDFLMISVHNDWLLNSLIWLWAYSLIFSDFQILCLNDHEEKN